MLTRLHHAASYQQTLCRMVETVLSPAVQTMQARIFQHTLQAQQLRQGNEELRAQLRRAQEARQAQL